MKKRHEETTPPNSGRQSRPRKDAERFMWAQAFLEIRSLTIGGLAMVVSSYTNQAVPRLMGRLMDPNSASQSDQKSPNTQAMNVLWVGVIGGAASFLRTLMLNRAQENIAARLRKSAFSSLMIEHDLEWYHMGEIIKENSKEKAEKSRDLPAKGPASLESPSRSLGMTPAAVAVILKDDVGALSSTLTTTTASILRSTSSCVFATYNMLLLNPSLVGLSLVVAPLVGGLAFLTRKIIKRVVEVQQDAALHAASFLEERLNHISMVKISNRENDETLAYSRIQDQLVELGKKSALANGFSMGAMFFLSTSALCGILLAGGRSVENKRMNHGELVSFGSYSFLLALGSAGLVSGMGEYTRGIESALRVYLLLTPSPDIATPSDAARKSMSSPTLDPSSIQELGLENLHFSYKSNPTKNVLKGVSLVLSRGEVVVVTGQNGSGKSTIAMLLAGLYKPTTGKILLHPYTSPKTASSQINQVDYTYDLTRNEQTRLVQVVPQSPALLNASILENVRYSKPSATEAEVSHALKAANCSEFVEKLEGGVTYQVGRNGCRLSGGQRQRLCLARALLSDPTFLVLDEPASSQDAMGETAIVEAINSCRKSNRSLLVITHRAKSLALADRVVVLKDGIIVEQGTYLELKKKKGELLSLVPDL